ncbi:MAG: hypothetical protein IT582_03500 [Opitutaceae bacterium]|nr:hypothetical protein [Opitutaceae bacterium]
MTRGFGEKALRGVEFRQAQTALTTYWVQQENDFALAYPTPVLGKPWSAPMEFPLYQWTVAGVSDLTHLSLPKAGRAVSMACFWLTLPAMFLLLARWGVAPVWRWPVLAVIVTLPFHIFYARAFLIETMALMFAVWFWVGFERGVASRNRWWLAVAVVAGTGAGLVKVTTFMVYLLPAGIWALRRLWAGRGGAWKGDLGWMAAAVALPFAATYGWVRYADAVKAENPLAHFLRSGELTYFNFGDMAMRLHGEVWAQQWAQVAERVAWLPATGLALVALLFSGGRQLRAVAGCLLAFAAALVLFPLLYALHEYYFMANALLLVLAMGLALAGWLASGRWRAAAWALVLGLPVLQGLGFAERFLPIQEEAAPDGNGMTDALRNVTQPDEVLVIAGQDWNSMTAYYARRKALMLRESVMRDSAQVTAALQRLQGERLGALVIAGQPDGEQWLIDEASRHGLTHHPVFRWRDCRVFLRQDREGVELARLLEEQYPEVEVAREAMPDPTHLKNRWLRYADLRPWEQRMFHAMTPRPLRIFSQFGPALDESGGWPRFGAHPVTRLIFQLPAGEHRLRMLVQLPRDACREDLEPEEKTDGVEISLYALGPNDVHVLLQRRLFDPVRNPADRGDNRTIEIPFNLKYPGEVELTFTPGPAGRDTRDWIQLGPLKIE